MALRNITAVRNLAVFGAVVVLCLFAPAMVRSFVGRMFEEFRAPMDIVPSHLNDLAKFWSLSSNTKRDLIEAGRDLGRLNSAYQTKVIENDSLHRQIARFERIINIPSEDKFKTEIARVMRRDINAWWQRMTIRKGKNSGIKVGYAVVYSGGVVGRIVEVTNNTSVVELVSSKKFRMAAHIAGEDRPIIYQGDGSVSFYNAKGTIEDAPNDLFASETEPLKLVTSSLAESFPDGILIGEIISLEQEPDGIFKSGKVRLGRGLSELREVAVLIPISDTER